VTKGATIPPVNGALLDLKQIKNKKEGKTISNHELNLSHVSLISIDQLEPCAQTNTTNNKAYAGLIVYNTTDNSETDNTLTPGIYYWDGAHWRAGMRIISRGYGPWYQVDKPTSPSYEVTTDSYLNAKAVVGGTDVINNATLSVNGNVGVNGKIGIGTSPNAVLDIRPNPSSTTDPGESFLGIGTTTVTAPDAGSGAIRYSTSSGGILEYSNGKTWNTLTNSLSKSIIVATKKTSQTIPNNTSSVVNGWVKETDPNNDFDESTGIFTAPRTGNFMISFGFSSIKTPIIAGSWVEANLNYRGSSNGHKKAVIPYTSKGTGNPGANITFTFALKAGDTVRPVIFQNTGSDLTLRVYSSTDPGGAGFNNISIVEL